MPNLANIQTFQQHYHIDINGNSKILETSLNNQSENMGVPCIISYGGFVKWIKCAMMKEMKNADWLFYIGLFCLFLVCFHFFLSLPRILLFHSNEDVIKTAEGSVHFALCPALKVFDRGIFLTCITWYDTRPRFKRSQSNNLFAI